MRKIFYLLCLLLMVLSKNFLWAYPSIIFIHIGEKLPPYLETAIAQARLFNQNSDIILVANEKALKNLNQKIEEQNIILISCESLPVTEEHKGFLRSTRFKPGFWRFTCERFLYLYDVMKYYDLEDIVHLENDNMIYVDVDQLLPLFQAYYPGIAATFDNDGRCIPGFMYIRNKQSMQKLAACFATHAKRNLYDMQLIAFFKNTHTEKEIDFLPIIPEEYALQHPLISPHRHKAKVANKYHNYIDVFQSIFDAAAIGQYLGGGGEAHPEVKPGFINESCIFNPALFTYEWIPDEEGRKVPYAVLGNKKIRINNLHVHCKQLFLFAS